jgi:hypothetical protein
MAVTYAAKMADVPLHAGGGTELQSAGDDVENDADRTPPGVTETSTHQARLRAAAYDVALAILEATAHGIRIHLPNFIGFAGVAGFLVYVLHAPVWSVGLGSAAGAIVVAHQRFRKKEHA